MAFGSFNSEGNGDHNEAGFIGISKIFARYGDIIHGAMPICKYYIVSEVLASVRHA